MFSVRNGILLRMERLTISVTLAFLGFVLGIVPPAHAQEDRDPIQAWAPEDGDPMQACSDLISEYTEDIWRTTRDIEELRAALIAIDESLTPAFEAFCIRSDILGMPTPSFCPDDSARIVFVTSSKHSGHLFGVPGANSICNALAAEAGLGGTYKAWISDGTSSPAATFVKSTLPYVLPDGLTRVADDWTDLTTGLLQNPIDQDENGAGVSPPLASEGGGNVWTNTTSFGTPSGLFNPCGNWYHDGPNSSWVGIGSTSSPQQSWSWSSMTPFCSEERRLYCFEQ